MSLSDRAAVPIRNQPMAEARKTMDEDFDIQTRSEETGLCYYTTIREAITKADRDPTVWKVSFAIASGERIRLVRREPTFWDKVFFWSESETEWVYQPI